MGQANSDALRRARYLVVALIVVATVLRLLWIGDMEYKSDEAINVVFLSRLDLSSFIPIAPVSQHAGIAHSSGFYYLVWAFLADTSPMAAVVAVAGLNSVILALALWVAVGETTTRRALAMCATNITLVVYSRKIWQPDLLAAWVCLGLALLARGLKLEHGPKRAGTLAGAGLSFVLAAHMYLGAGVAAAVVGAYMFFWFLATRRRKDALAWALGSGLGWFSFVPWVIAIVRNVPGSHGPSAMATQWSSRQIPPLLTAAATVTTPIQFYDAYLKPVAGELLRGHWGDDFFTLSRLLDVTTIVGFSAFWLAIAAAFVAWRKALRNPVFVASLLAIAFNIPAVFALRLGSWAHYWLGVIPLASYVVAWSVTAVPLRPWARLQRGLIWTFCVSSALASFCFLLLVHANRGLPGEYGRAYSDTVTAHSAR